MSTPTPATTTQLNNPGSLNGQPPIVEKLKWESGAFPSRNEAKKQIQEQMKLDTTVTDAGSGKGDSKLPGDGLRKADPKVVVAKKAEDKKNLEAAGEKAKEPEAKAKEDEPADEPAKEEPEAKAKRANAQLRRQRESEKQLQEARAKIAELEAKTQTTKESEELFTLAKRDPVAFLQKAGFKSLEEFAQTVLADQNTREERLRVENLEKSIKDRDEREKAERAQQATNARLAQSNNAIAAHFQDINVAIAAKAEDLEFSALKMKGEKVPLTVDTGAVFMVEPAIADAYSIQEHAIKELGRVLTVDEVCDALERYYEGEYSGLKGSKKLAKLLGEAGEEAPKKSAAKKESPTLGGRKMAGASTSGKVAVPVAPVRKDFKNDQQFQKALVEWGENRLRILKETKAQ
jgi:hypothetical protein